MKFVNMDELLAKVPNKYKAIVLAAKEARKIIEARRPPSVPKEPDILPPTAVVPEIEVTPNEPKKRGRKPKITTLEKAETEKRSLKTEFIEEPIETVTIEETRVTAEKLDENPYIAALRKITHPQIKTAKEKK
jgi:DNA-directed RNA polymerase omega subunit